MPPPGNTGCTVPWICSLASMMRRWMSAPSPSRWAVCWTFHKVVCKIPLPPGKSLMVLLGTRWLSDRVKLPHQYPRSCFWGQHERAKGPQGSLSLPSRPRGRFMRHATVLRKDAVLSIFWTLPIIGPMFSNGSPHFLRSNSKKGTLDDMKRFCFAFAAVGLLVCLAGCCTADRHSSCGCGSDCPQGPIAAPCSQAPCNQAPCQESRCVGAMVFKARRPPMVLALMTATGRAPGLGPNRGAMDASGPPTAAIAYPYYTTRGPRDFLDRNPQSIGP